MAALLLLLLQASPDPDRPLLEFGDVDSLRYRRVAWSPDGARLAAGDSRGSITLWNPETGRRIAVRSRVHTAGIAGLKFCPTLDRVALSAAENGMMLAWEKRDLEDWREIPARGHSIRCLDFSPDGKRMAAGSTGSSETLVIWDFETGKKSAVLRGHLGEVGAVAYSPSGGRLASGGKDRTVRWWDVERGREIRAWARHSAEVTALAIGRDGRWLVSGSRDGAIEIWDLERQAHAKPLGALGHEVRFLAFRPTCGRLLVSGGSTELRVWDVESRKELRRIRCDWEAYGIAFHPEGRRFATAHDDTRIRIWSLEEGK